MRQEIHSRHATGAQSLISPAASASTHRNQKSVIHNLMVWSVQVSVVVVGYPGEVGNTGALPEKPRTLFTNPNTTEHP